MKNKKNSDMLDKNLLDENTNQMEITKSTKRPLGFLKSALSDDALQRLDEAMLEPTNQATIEAWESLNKN